MHREPDVFDEPKIDTSEAAVLLGVHRETVLRYMTRGTEDGLRLEAIRVNGIHKTSVAAVRRFVDAQQPEGLKKPGRDPNSPGRTKRRNRQAHEEAMERLRKEGMLT